MTGLAAAGTGAFSGVVSASRGWSRRIRLNGVLVGLSLLWLALVVLAAVAPAVLAPGDPVQLHPTEVLRAPGPDAVLGTEQYGRSVYVLLVHGARTALTIGVAATALAVVAGSLIGLVAGYAGGVVDALIGRVLDVMMALPGVLLALLITAAAGPSVGVLIVSVGVASIAGFARLMRGEVISTRTRLYVEAARATGISPARILMRHVLPNAAAPVAALATIAVGEAILAAAALSFLGLGPRLDVPDWGQLLASGQAFLRQSWWVSVFAGAVISLTVVSVGLVGDWLRERTRA
ncbi:ABC transporter permease [Microbacterium marinilacus]|uniref:ABC transporter permease n=1 Tax=Microbacterium marinilacus TaxID=415209 RepID=A0ABP7BT87_9MICO|nr:ABC transporter permease [Microbacterium marinilacus]MBY0690247.1 ABC transporter permease [Microbacterium marinilacus]